MKSVYRIAVLVIMIGISSHSYSQKKGKQTPLMKTLEQPIEISAFELRLNMNEFFILFSGVVEESADSIATSAQDPLIKQNALLWKMYAIPTAQRSVMVSDPFAAFTDAAALSIQMLRFFEEGKGQDLFGEWQFIAISASRKLWKEIKSIGTKLSYDRDITQGVELMENYSKNNPIRSLYFTRRSTLPLQAKFIEVEKVKLKALAENLTAGFEELSTRLNFYTEALPKQVRWQSEYMLGEILSNQNVQERIDSLMSLMSIAERLAVVAESTSNLVDMQREAVMDDIRKERIIILNTLHQERVDVSSDLGQARDQIMDDIWENISRERLAAFEDVEGILARAVELSFEKVDALTTKIFKLALLAFGLGFVAAAFLIVLYKKILA